MAVESSSAWNDHLSKLENVFTSTLKLLRKLPADPFEVLERINAARVLLESAGVNADRVLSEIRLPLESECLRQEVEFWGQFSEACAERGWEVLGSTNRRLVSRSLFLSLEQSEVKIEGFTKAFTPFVPALMPVLAVIVEKLEPSVSELKSFSVVLAKAYDAIPKSATELSLEAVYRQCIIEVQKSSFWRNPTTSAFIPLSRPAFRCRISEILRTGLLTPDGRSIALGTTTTSKDAWEIFSPGEQRVVVAGRISLTRAGDDDEH